MKGWFFLTFVIIFFWILISTDNDLRKNTYHQVICDSGFKTPWSKKAYIYRGVIRWNTIKSNTILYKRKMTNGETCHEISEYREAK